MTVAGKKEEETGGPLERKEGKKRENPKTN